MPVRVSRTRVNLGDIVLQRAEMRDYSETVMTGTGTTDINLELGNVFEITMNGNLTFTFSNPPVAGNSGVAGSFTLILIQDGTGSRLATWPGTVDWHGGVAPTLTTTGNAVDIITFLTTNGGGRWYGFVAGQNMS